MAWQQDAVFSAAVEIVLRDEGGYVNDPADPGGETNFGISKRSYPDLDIKDLSAGQAIAIYYSDWWCRYGYGRLPPSLATKLLDVAVPAPRAAHRSLQRALRAAGGGELADDGEIGPQTVAAANRCAPAAVLAALRSEFAGYCRMVAAHYLAVNGRPDPFLAGWLVRAYA